MTALCDSCSPREGCTAEKNRTECRFYQPMTEQEYIQTCNTEQLAEFLIASIKKCKSCASGIGADEVADCPFGECGCHFKDEVVKWLKQPHHESVTNCNE